MSPDSLFRLYGTRDAEPEPKILKAGRLSVEFAGGALRYIRFDGQDVLRAISFLVRDRDWGTCEPDMSDLLIHERADGFDLSWTSAFTAPDGARLTCQNQIEAGSGDATVIRFRTTFAADRAFQTARTGFCVLHPIVGVSGGPVEVLHSDGVLEKTRWPEAIDPWQPFKDIQAIKHWVTPDVTATCRFSGDTFEMEDQRNWSDGSYKTYVRPLALAWPYDVPQGARFEQSVTLTVEASSNAAADVTTGTGPIRLDIGPVTGTHPQIGVGLRPDCQAEEIEALATLQASGAQHLVCLFDPLAGHGLAELQHFAVMAQKSGLPVTLECALPCVQPFEDELLQIAEQVKSAGLTLHTLMLSPAVDRQSTPPGSRWPDCPPLADIYAAARRSFPGVRLGGGMLSYFTELNRKRVPGDALDMISHCTNPIVHAADDRSVMETLEAVRDIVSSARKLYPSHPYRIGPVTIAMRQNPYGSSTKDNPLGKRIPMANRDPRHNGLFGAAYAIGFAASVADADLELLTLSTLAGSFGLVAGNDEPAAKGSHRPLFAAVSALSRLSGLSRLAVASSDPSAILALGAKNGAGHQHLLLVNVTSKPQIVDIGGMQSDSRLSIFDEVWMISGQDRPQPVVCGASVTLPPFAFAEIV